MMVAMGPVLFHGEFSLFCITAVFIILWKIIFNFNVCLAAKQGPQEYLWGIFSTVNFLLPPTSCHACCPMNSKQKFQFFLTTDIQPSIFALFLVSKSCSSTRSSVAMQNPALCTRWTWTRAPLEVPCTVIYPYSVLSPSMSSDISQGHHLSGCISCRTEHRVACILHELF